MHALMKGAAAGEHPIAKLELVDKATFYRFYQFVYTGNYNGFIAPYGEDRTGSNGKIALPTAEASRETTNTKIQPALLEASTSTPKEVSTHTSGAGVFEEASLPNTFAPEENHARHDFKLPYSLVSCRDAMRMTTTAEFPAKRKRKAEVLSDNDADLHFSFKSRAISLFLQNHVRLGISQTTPDISQCSPVNVLLGHTKIWKFAEKYDITPLMNVASSRLAYELACWVINDSEFVTDFGKLIRYLYQGFPAGSNALQLLTAQFAACIVEDMKGLEGWVDLIKEVPAFSNDLGNALVEVYCEK